MSQVHHANRQGLTSVYLLVWSKVLHDKLMVCQPTQFTEPGKSLYSKSLAN